MLSFLAFLAGAGLVVFLNRAKVVTVVQTRNGTEHTVNVSRAVVTGVLAIVAGTFLGGLVGGIQVVPAGRRAVVFDRVHGVKPVALGEGLNFVTPFIQDAIIVNVQVQKAEFEATAASKDLQDVKTKVALNYHAIPENVSTIYKDYGLDIEEKVVHPAVQETVKAVTALYTAEELITKREEVKVKIQALLAELISRAQLKLDTVYVTDFDFSKNFTEAIEGKQIAEQNALKSKRVLEQVKIEAEQKIASARAEAESLRLQKDQVSPQMIELRRIEAQIKAIEKWNGKLPEVMLGNGTTPLVDLSKLTNK